MLISLEQENRLRMSRKSFFVILGFQIFIFQVRTLILVLCIFMKQTNVIYCDLFFYSF